MRLKISIALLFLPLICLAQFSNSGTERAIIKWSYIETPTYKVIYPNGLDSLARVYATKLESAVLPVSYSLGMKPNQAYRSKHPVVLHPYESLSNGMVASLPMRTELYTIPDILNPISTTWEHHLITHESRHIAQSQFFASKPFLWTRYLSGELIGLAPNTIYYGSVDSEGDAVVAETVLSQSGRGRSADFLEYYRVSFAEGIMRNRTRWTFNSQRYYTPDHYKIGYITHAGIRTYLGFTDYNQALFANIARTHGLGLNSSSRVLRDRVGGNKAKAVKQICDSLRADWQEDEIKRAPYMQCDTLLGENRYFTEYSDLSNFSGQLYAVRQGLTLPCELIRISNGRPKKVASLSGAHSSPIFSEATQSLYWHDYQADLRYEMHSYSTIYSFDGRVKRKLVSKSRYFNPTPSQDKAELAVVELPHDGKYAIAVLDAISGQFIRRYPCPSGLQPVEAVWIGSELFASAISDKGFGIYKLDNWDCILEPAHTKIKQLREGLDYIQFVCDRSGVNELYELDPQNGELVQLSNTRFGLSDYCFNTQRDTLFFSSLTPRGRMICSTKKSELLLRKVQLSNITEQPMVRELVESEKKNWPESEDYDAHIDGTAVKEVSISKPMAYSKSANAIKVHSWLPVFFDYDAIKSSSYETISSAANLGVSAFFQNDLSTLSGQIGVAAMDNNWNWRPNGLLSLTYRGLYPIFEGKLRFNSRNAHSLCLVEKTIEDQKTKIIEENTLEKPLLSGSLRAYIPFNFSSGSWQRAVIPSASVIASNELMTLDKKVLMSKANMSIRGYIMESIPSSRVYPRWGIGAEYRYSFRPGLTDLINANIYYNVYAYIPGLYETNGFRVSYIRQLSAVNALFNENVVTTLPRGFDSSIYSLLGACRDQIKNSFDYTIPFLPIDFPFFFYMASFRNLELTLHHDITNLSIQRGWMRSNLSSTGADLCLKMAFASGSAVKLGISFNYLSWNLQKSFEQKINLIELGYLKKPYKLGFIFTADI